MRRDGESATMSMETIDDYRHAFHRGTGRLFTIEIAMKSLHDINSFPEAHRDVLERQFGIASAEAFFEHATRNAPGMQTALQLTPAELDKLRRLVEGHLSPEFVKRCQDPVGKHRRGVIVD